MGVGTEAVLESLNFSGHKRLPVILQTEVSECGLASLGMVASYYGREMNLNELRRQFTTTLKGFTLHDLAKMADQLDLNARPLKLDIESLNQLSLPAVLHWDMNHFVVLKSVHRRHVVIHDPAVGERKVTFMQLSDHFTGVALELAPTFSFKPKKQRSQLKLSMFWRNMGGLGKALLQIFAVSLLMQLLVIAAPIYMQVVLDEVVVTADFQLLTTLAIGFLLVLVINVAVTALRSVIVLYLSSHMTMSMGYHLFQHLLKVPLEFFEKRHMGDIVSRFGSLTAIKEFLANGAVTAIVDLMMVTATLIMMFIYAPILAALVLASVFIYLSVRLMLYRSLRQRTEDSVIAAAKSDSNFMETVRGMQSIKLFGAEVDRKNLWATRYADVVNSDIRLGRFRISYDAFNSAVFGAEHLLVIFIAAHMVLSAQLTIGMMMAFVAYKMQFTQKASSLVEQLIEFKMLDVHLDRIADIALADVDQYQVGNSHIQTIAHGKLELRAVDYRHSQIDPQILHRADLIVEPGQSVAIVGPSGCGKTTLMKLMLGLFQPDSGAVLVDGVDIKQMGLARYRQQIGAVMQDDQLLSGSIADNICFFDPKPDMARIQQCAFLAAINRDIEAMPMGYNSLVGDMGTTLSGGQKQRVLLARALYRKPKILFLDEATSHLDTRLEGVVNWNLKQHNITTIMIAHRPDTIRSADRIFRLEDGQLHEVVVEEVSPKQHSVS